MKIQRVIPSEGNLLQVVSDDGRVGLFDASPFLQSEAFLPLKDQKEFEKIHNGGYFIEWDCGADLSADTIGVHWKPVSHGNAQ